MTNPKCPECLEEKRKRQPYGYQHIEPSAPEMREVGSAGHSIQEVDMEGNIIGVRTEMLYQCPICKHCQII